MERITLYHANKQIVEFPEVRKTKFTKDFSWGFYCTNNLKRLLAHSRDFSRELASKENI